MSVNLASLEPQQLVAFKQSTQQELVHLQSSYDALVIAQNKYKDCINSVNMIEENKDSNDDKEMLIPLTSSLYVRGFNSIDKFKIDVGTGYFVEKDNTESIAFFKKRIDKLTGDSAKLKGLITEKVSLLQSIDSIIREKVIAANANKTASS
jgi:prefoldin alpha subunit